MLKKFSCLIIIIILLGFAVIAQSQPPIPIGTQQNYQYPTKSTDEQPYKDKYNTESLKTTLKEITSKYQNQNIKNTGSQEHHWYDTFLDNTTNWLLVLFNLLLVVVTSLLVLYNYRLWKANVGLWEVSQEQSRHMETSIGVAHKAADAATATVKTMRDTAGRQLRAYLSARFETIFIFSPTIRVTIKFIMLNHGQTPAYNVTHSSLVEVLPYPLPINYQLPSISPPQTPPLFCTQQPLSMDIVLPLVIFLKKRSAESLIMTAIAYIHSGWLNTRILLVEVAKLNFVIP